MAMQGFPLGLQDGSELHRFAWEDEFAQCRPFGCQRREIQQGNIAMLISG